MPASQRSSTTGRTSLDMVAAHLKDPIESFLWSSKLDRRSSLCNCLSKYTSTLCKLQDIEIRQQPVQADTFLTCVNVVLNLCEDQLGCVQCIDDYCVTMQLVMIFQMLLTWGQSHLGDHEPRPVLQMALGQHLLTSEEQNIVHTALVSKALGRIGSYLKLVASRADRASLQCEKKQGRGLGKNVSWHIQQLIKDLMQDIDCIDK